MTSITIHDLPDNLDLDRQAMQAIVGGARMQGVGVPGSLKYRAIEHSRLVDYPTLPNAGTAPRTQARPVAG